jgi:hypothetical protein
MVQFNKNVQAIKYLREYQKAYFEVTKVKIPTRKEVQDNADKLVEKNDFLNKMMLLHHTNDKEYLKSHFIDGSTSEEDYVTELSNRVLNIIDPKIRDTISQIPVGLLPTNDFNASAIKTTSGDSIIVLNSGIISYTQIVIDSLLGTVLSPKICTHEEAISGIINWTSVFTSGKPLTGLTKPPSLTEPYSLALSVGIRDALYIFIIGHEYGHFLLKHHTVSKTIEKNIIPNKDIIPLQFYLQKQEHEYEADKIGFELCFDYCRYIYQGTDDIAYISIIFAIHILRLFEVFLDTNINSHPESLSRREKFEKLYFNCIYERTKKKITDMDNFMNIVHSNLVKIVDINSKNTQNKR